MEQGKDYELIPISNRTSDLWIPCSDALPLSHRGYDEHGPLQSSTPLHQYTYSTYCYPYISQGTDKENLINNQELLQSVIIASILVTLMCDFGLILFGEIRC